jgi:hypothetical protein
MPAFENLLPEPHGEIALTLLFLLAQWHALAKLRMYTESTLDTMMVATVKLGQQVRKFKAVTCKAFQTHELTREVEARAHRQRKVAPKSHPDTNQPKPQARIKQLNLSTYKFHSLGDYVESI